MTPTAHGRGRPSTLAVATALGIVYVVWGSTYFAIAVMIQTLPPLLAAGVRYALAGGLVLGFLVARARWRAGRGASEADRERITGAHWRAAAIVGTLLLLGGNGGVVLAELFIPSGMAAVLIAMVPIWLSVFDAILTRRRPSWLVIGGLLAGITGVVVLLFPVEGLDRLDPLGVGLCVIAEISWAAGSVYAKRAPLPRSGLRATGMEMLAGGGALFLTGMLLGEIGRTDISQFSVASLLALAYLVVFGSILAFTAYTWLLAHVPVSTVGTYAYVNPIVAVALGAILLSEPITLRTLIASVLIIGAVVAMVWGRPREDDPAAARASAPDVGGPTTTAPLPEPGPRVARPPREELANE